jgi:hypothetical protein
MARTTKRYLLVNGSVRTVKDGADIHAVIRSLEDKGATVLQIKAPPTVQTMYKWSDAGIARATDGCKCEPDGACVHGHKSWMLVLGVI